MEIRNTGIRSGRNVVFFLLLVALVFLLRSLWTHPIDHGDAVQKYYWAAQILRSGDWSLLLHNHHTMRWAAMLPQTGLTWLLGGRYEVFYILPLLMFSIYNVLIVFGLRNILNPSQLLLLGSILFIEPLTFFTSNEFLIPGIGVCFAIAGILVLINQGIRHHLGVVLSAVLFFIAYGAHVSYLSFAAGGFIWLVMVQRNRSKSVIFAGTIMVLMVLEVLVFNYLSGWQLTLGRIEALAIGPHVERSMTYSVVTFDQLLTRWLQLPIPDILLNLVFLMAGPWLIWKMKKGSHVPEVIQCTYLVGLCFAVAVTFTVSSINPIRPVMPLQPRYLVPFFPFAAVITVYMSASFVTRVLGVAHSGIERVASSVIAVFFLVWPTAYMDFYSSKFEAFMWKSDEAYTEFSEKFQQGQLILTGNFKVAGRMIASFKHPLKTLNLKRGISVPEPAPDASCVVKLTKVPLELNYEPCGST